MNPTVVGTPTRRAGTHHTAAVKNRHREFLRRCEAPVRCLYRSGSHKSFLKQHQAVYPRAPDPRPFLAPLRGSPAQYRLPAVPTVVGPGSAYAVPAAYMPWQRTRGAPTAHGANDGHHPGAISGAIWRDLAQSQPDLSPRRTAPPTACCDRSRRRPWLGLGLGFRLGSGLGLGFRFGFG